MSLPESAIQVVYIIYLSLETSNQITLNEPSRLQVNHFIKLLQDN